MKLNVRGRVENIEEHIVGPVTRKSAGAGNSSILLLDGNLPIPKDFSGLAVLSTEEKPILENNIKLVYNLPSLDHLFEGDIVSVGNDGNVHTLYRVNSYHNTLLATERCNSNCLMCSQPPRDRNDIPLIYNIHQKLIPLIPKNCIELGISGGEPTLMGDLFFKTLESLKVNLPDTEIHVLSNGRSFAWLNMVERLARINYDRLMIGIPLYADYYRVHDYIVQAKDAFNQTILGLHNLARFNQRIEIRVVLHKLSIPRLVRLAKYIYKNLPFAEHIAFMGLEFIGYTPHNIDKLWIDPHSYVEELGEAVEFLAGQGMNVSIYNSQLCVMPQELWKFCRKSISDWKNDYLPECKICAKRDDCGGLFTWNLKKHSEYITPFSS